VRRADSTTSKVRQSLSEPTTRTAPSENFVETPPAPVRRQRGG
jgi:hypothetical protein